LYTKWEKKCTNGTKGGKNDTKMGKNPPISPTNRKKLKKMSTAGQESEVTQTIFPNGAEESEQRSRIRHKKIMFFATNRTECKQKSGNFSRNQSKKRKKPNLETAVGVGAHFSKIDGAAMGVGEALFL
jgi:hypothetical protein